jgi:hypothetical protein
LDQTTENSPFRSISFKKGVKGEKVGEAAQTILALITRQLSKKQLIENICQKTRTETY